MHLILSFVLIVLSCSKAKGRSYTCLSCSDVTSPSHCNKITRCGPNEKCFVDSYVDTLGFIRYNLGCRDSHMCSGSPIVGKRSSPLICQECCDGEICNNQGCGKTGFQPASSRGPICFHCDTQNQADGCSVITQCSKLQVCKLGTMTASFTRQNLFYSGCETRAACTAEQAKTNGTQCPTQCCDADLCNKQCSSAQVTPSMGTNPCLSNPCVFGTCSIYLNTYKCTCQPGYHGRDCHQQNVVDHCLSNPCHNGNCVNGQSGYTCICQTGFTGKNCATVSAIAHCRSNPCIHGRCVSSATNYTCTCDPGFSGSNCDLAIDHCRSNPCVHGKCVSSATYYTCTCDPGFSGSNCDLAIDHCQSNPCVHGRCVSSATNYTCTCDLGFSGSNCDLAVGHLLPWTQWSSCNVTCGEGASFRIRACAEPQGGVPCDNSKSLVDFRTCRMQTCPDTSCLDQSFCSYTQNATHSCTDIYFAYSLCPQLCGRCGELVRNAVCGDLLGVLCTDDFCQNRATIGLCVKTCGLCI